MITRADDGATSLPQLPQSREAFEIAHALLRTPGTDDTEAQFAQRAGISIRTLQRYFVEETGLTSRAGGYELGSPRRWST